MTRPLLLAAAALLLAGSGAAALLWLPSDRNAPDPPSPTAVATPPDRQGHAGGQATEAPSGAPPAAPQPPDGRGIGDSRLASGSGDASASGAVEADAAAAAAATAAADLQPDLLAAEGSDEAHRRCGALPAEVDLFGVVAVAGDPDWEVATGGRSCVLRGGLSAHRHPTVAVYQHPRWQTLDVAGWRALPSPAGCGSDRCPQMYGDGSPGQRTVIAVADDGHAVVGVLLDPDGALTSDLTEAAQAASAEVRLLVGVVAAADRHWRERR